MTRQEFLPIIQKLRAVYRDFLADEESVNTWYDLLKDMDAEVLKLSVIKYMQTQKFPPYPSDLRGQIVSKEFQMSPEEAWAIVDKALWSCTSFEKCEEVFERLPEPIKKTLGSPSTLHSYTQGDYANGIMKSLFIKSYTSALESAKVNQRMSEPVRKVVDRIESYEVPETPLLEIKGEEEEREHVEIDPRYQELLNEVREEERRRGMSE